MAEMEMTMLREHDLDLRETIRVGQLDRGFCVIELCTPVMKKDRYSVVSQETGESSPALRGSIVVGCW